MPNPHFALASRALPAYGLEGASLASLQHLVNTTFAVRRGDERWFMRVYCTGRHDRSAIASEMLWMEALADAGLPVPRPRRALDGELVWDGREEGDAPPVYVSITSWIDGDVVPTADRRPAHYGALGRLLATAHRVAACWRPPVGFARPRCDAAGIYGPDGGLGPVAAIHQALPAALRTDLERARHALLAAEASVGREAPRYGLIHADPSFGNVLWRDGQPALVDFDDCAYGHYAYDLAVVLAGAWGKPAYDEHRAALLRAYRESRTMSPQEIAALPALMAARAASLIYWCAGRSPTHPWIAGQWERLNAYLGY